MRIAGFSGKFDNMRVSLDLETQCAKPAAAVSLLPSLLMRKRLISWNTMVLNDELSSCSGRFANSTLTDLLARLTVASPLYLPGDARGRCTPPLVSCFFAPCRPALPSIIVQLTRPLPPESLFSWFCICICNDKCDIAHPPRMFVTFDRWQLKRLAVLGGLQIIADADNNFSAVSWNFNYFLWFSLGHTLLISCIALHCM